MFCPNCWKKIENENAKFCESCGTAFGLHALRETPEGTSVVYMTLTLVFSGIFLLLCLPYYYIVYVYQNSYVSLSVFSYIVSFFNGIHIFVFIILFILLLGIKKLWWLSIIFGALYILLFATTSVYGLVKLYRHLSGQINILNLKENLTFNAISYSAMALGMIIFIVAAILLNRPRKRS